MVGEQFMTDTADYADIVLPNTTQVEQLDLVFSWGQMYITLNLPAVAPLGEAVSNREKFAGSPSAWASRTRFTMSDEERRSGGDALVAPDAGGHHARPFKEKGWARLSIPSPDEYAPHAEGGFPTPSGESSSSRRWRTGGNFVVSVFREGYNELQSGAAVDPLPHCVRPPRRARAPRIR